MKEFSPSFSSWIRDFRYWHISFTDLFEILKKEKTRLILIFLAVWSLCFLKNLTRPITYTASAIFKDSNAMPAGSLSKTLDFMLGADSSGSHENAYDLLDSYGVVSKVIKNLKLQGTITENNGQSKLKTMWNNLILERRFAHLKSFERPQSYILSDEQLVPLSPIKSPSVTLKFRDLKYDAECFTVLTIEFKDNDNFVVRGKKGKYIGEGNVSSPFYFLENWFLLEKSENASLKGKTFTLSLIPMSIATKGLSKKIVIKKDKTKLSFINISYASHDRYLSYAVVNELMDGYQKYVIEKNKEKITKQLQYLNQRKDETLQELEKIMGAHEVYLKEHVGQGGFLDLDHEAQFLMHKQADLLAQASELKFKIRRMASKIFGESCISFDALLQMIDEAKEELSSDHITEPLSLAISETLFSEYIALMDQYECEIRHYQFCIEELAKDDIDVTALINTLKEPLLQGFVKDIQIVFTQFHDVHSWTEKEKEFFKEQLKTKKDIVVKELVQFIDGRQMQKKVLLKKVNDLEKSYLLLLLDELEKNQTVLKDLSNKEADFPKKWFEQKKMHLNIHMAESFVENVAKAIEGKNLHYHLTSVDSYPVEYAILPFLPNEPKLFYKPTLFAAAALFLYLAFLFINYLYRGPTASFKNLKASGLSVFAEIEASVTDHFGKLKELSFAMIQKKDKSNLVLVSSQVPVFFLNSLLQLFEMREEKILLLDLKKAFVSLGFNQEEVFKEEYLSSEKFKNYLEELKQSYQWVFIFNQAHPLSLQTKILQGLSNFVIYFATTERIYELWSLPEETCFLTLKIEKVSLKDKAFALLKSEKDIYLRDAAPLIEKLQSNINSSPKIFTTSQFGKWFSSWMANKIVK